MKSHAAPLTSGHAAPGSAPFGFSNSYVVHVVALLLVLVGALTAGVWVGSMATQTRMETLCTEHFGAVRLSNGARGHSSSFSADGELGGGGSPADGTDSPARRSPVVLSAPRQRVDPPTRPKCTNKTVEFELHDGTRVARESIVSYVTNMQTGGVVELTAHGRCGGFADAETKLLVRSGKSSDVRVLSQVFLSDEFAWLDKVYPDRSQVRRIMDFGSNCGMSLLLLSHMYPNAKIIGVEPEIHNFGVLTLNTGHRPNIFLERGAAGATIRFDRLQSVASGSWGFGVKPSDGDFDETRVFPAYTVSYLLDKHEWSYLDFLKVDIEGSELELCEDVMAGAKWVERVRCLSFELHDRFFKNLEPRDRITRTCAEAMLKSGMTHMGQFGELVTWCRLDPALKEELERTRARAQEQKQGRAARLF